MGTRGGTRRTSGRWVSPRQSLTAWSRIECGWTSSGSQRLFRSGLLLDVPPHRAPYLPVRPDLLLQILHAHPSLERLLRARVPAAVSRALVVSLVREEPLNKGRNLVRDSHDVLRILASKERHVIHVEDPDQLVDRLRMVVDPEGDPPVVEPAGPSLGPDDKEGGALLSAAVPARVLPPDEGREELRREVPLRGLVRAGHLLHDTLPRQDVPLARVPAPDDVARPCVALLAGVRGGPPAGVDDPDLPLGPVAIAPQEGDEDLLRSRAAL